MEIELKHLAAYLPYGIKFLPTHYNIEKKIDTLYYLSTISNSNEFGVNGYTSNYIKPILRPLSDLTKEITVNGETFVPIDKLEEIHKGIDIYQPLNLKYPIEINIQTEDYSQDIDLHDGYLIIQKLLEWHFDIYGLIPAGLAIDINTLHK